MCTGYPACPAVLEASIKEVTVPEPVAVTETVPTPAINTPNADQSPPPPPPPIPSNDKRPEDVADNGGDDSDKEHEGEGDATPRSQ